MIGGAILFGAELALVDAQFYLVFVGSAAILVGVLVAFMAVEEWAQWALFALLAGGSMMLFRADTPPRFAADPAAMS
jgi:membrane protein implicated in regulation of membrane protease activity